VTLSAPEPLGDHHSLDTFESGTASLDEWLRRRARANQVEGATRVYVVCEERRVVGYYALASGSICTSEAVGRFRRNMPDPIPVVVRARLAIDHAWQGRKLGRALVRDAASRVLAAAAEIGVRGLIVHAISEEAKAFYLALGFLPSPTHDMTLMIPIGDLRASLQEHDQTS
jgi:predicted N-acetyltransferase YhbS